jgi:hypothetical protein
MTIEEMRTIDSTKTYKELQEAKQRIKRLEREIELLRFYGNRDCLGMADEVIASEIVTAYPMVWKEVKKEAKL